MKTAREERSFYNAFDHYESASKKKDGKFQNFSPDASARF